MSQSSNFKINPQFGRGEAGGSGTTKSTDHTLKETILFER